MADRLRKGVGPARHGRTARYLAVNVNRRRAVSLLSPWVETLSLDLAGSAVGLSQRYRLVTPDRREVPKCPTR